MSLLTTQGVRIIQVFVAATVVLTLFFTLSHFGADAIRSSGVANHVKLPDRVSGLVGRPPTPSHVSKPPDPKPANATLDFQEIIYLSMPYRTDRQDQLSLIAAVSGLKLTMLPGVPGDGIHPKAMPGHIGGNNMTGTPALGIWRAHANAWRYIIDNDIQSALIIEDDVDWDVNIKDVMGLMNWQLRYNNTIRWGAGNVQRGWNEDCPYGCDWDELFVGQCGGMHNPKRLDLHQVFPDPNSDKLETMPEWVKRDMTKVWNLTESEGIRVLSATYEPLCLMGYGVSRMGAMRMLYRIGGWLPFGNPVDNEIAWRTAEGVLSGYTLTPPVITSWRVGGSQDSDNDAIMDAKAPNTEGPSKGVSLGMKNSVRKYLKTYFEKNYWADMEKNRALQDLDR